MNTRGTALVATLVIVLILLPLGAFVAMQCRTDLLIQHNLRAEIEAFYTAEAGLEHAISEITPGTSFSALLIGPDHRAGTIDDGIFPFNEGPPAPFPQAPLRYDVRVAQVDNLTIRMVSTGTGVRNTSKVVSALVTRSILPYTPGALYVQDDPAGLDLGTAGFLVSGIDGQISTSSATTTGASAAIPALSTSRADAALALAQSLTANAADRLIGAGGTPSISSAQAFDVEPYATAIAQRAERVSLSTPVISGQAVLGTAQTPQISVATGNCEVQGMANGDGILFVSGSLRVTGSLNFTGLVVAAGGFVFEPGSSVTIDGAFWQGAADSPSLGLRGAGAIAYSSTALAAIDRAFPGMLPHGIVVAGWQEQL